MHSPDRTTVVAAVIAVAFAVYYMLSQGWGQTLEISSDILFVLVSGCTTLISYLSATKVGFKGRFAWTGWGLFLGIFLWFLGELVWTIYEVALQIPIPYPSFADIFYLAGYAPIMIAIVVFLYAFRDALVRRGVTMAAITGLSIVALIIALLLYPLSVTSEDLLTKIFDMAYPTLDAGLLFLAVTMLFLHGSGTLAKGGEWISIGVFLTSVGALLFSLGTMQGWYYSGHPVELPYLWGYLAVSLGLDTQRKTLQP